METFLLICLAWYPAFILLGLIGFALFLVVGGTLVVKDKIADALRGRTVGYYVGLALGRLARLYWLV